METVAAGDRIAVQFEALSRVAEMDARALALEVVDADVLDTESQRQAAEQPRRDQVLDDLGLAVTSSSTAKPRSSKT